MIKSAKAYAVIKKLKNKINPLDIFSDKDVELGKDEEIWEVEIMPIKRIKK